MSAPEGPAPADRTAGRLMALDAVRGIAVIGMYLQHFGTGSTVASIVSGNTTLLFVLCGGISYMLMAARMLAPGADPVPFRARMLARAVFIDVIGYALIMLNSPFGVILPAYAALFVLALLLVQRSRQTLLWTATILLFVAPPLMLLGMKLFRGLDLLTDIAGGPMSALALAPAFVAGMAIGCFDLTRTDVAVFLTGIGTTLFGVGKLLAATVLPGWNRWFEAWLAGRMQGFAPPDPHAVWPLNTDPGMWHMMFWSAPHSASTFQTLSGLGASLVVLGLVCLVVKKAGALLAPFAAVGRVALTMYAAQFLAIWALQLGGLPSAGQGTPWSNLFVVLMALLVGWLLASLPNGPLEGLMRRFDQAFSGFRARVATPLNQSLNM